MSSGRTSENQQFTYDELKIITKDFEEEIGRGGFGSVYAGQLEDGTKVAVKKRSSSSSQGDKEFSNEANILTRAHHKHLVSLIGYCNDEDCLALVYEYMPEGTLEDKLRGYGRPLTWKRRLQIAYESAQGLEYLHNCYPKIIHRDVKTSNILLNSKLEAKIADFGLSREFDNVGTSHVSTKVSGTPGYWDPSYCGSGMLTARSDVYSFGVVMLEIVTGKPPIIRGQDDGFVGHVKDWVDEKLSKGQKKNVDQRVSREHVESVIDPWMQSQYEINSIRKFIELAKKCIEQSPHKRPTMDVVVAELKASLEFMSHSTPVNDMPIATAIKIFFGFKNKRNSHLSSKMNGGTGLHEDFLQFTGDQLKLMTNDFSENNIIGKHEFGTFYRGLIVNKIEVAVNMSTDATGDDIKQFISEAKILMQVRHKNLVTLIGYCMDENMHALVCEYMPNGSLYDHLTSENNTGRVLNWAERLRIALESAQGLDYLHTGCEIAHRDVKSNNILLGPNFEAKVADFSLAKMFNECTGMETDSICGTLGYIDPEVFYNPLGEKSDVYSFGIVLLEIITGEAPIQPGRENNHLVAHVKNTLAKGTISDIVDSRLESDYNEKTVWKVFEMAIRCTNVTSLERPIMAEVVTQLRDCLSEENHWRSKNMKPEGRVKSEAYSDGAKTEAYYVGVQSEA